MVRPLAELTTRLSRESLRPRGLSRGSPVDMSAPGQLKIRPQRRCSRVVNVPSRIWRCLRIGYRVTVVHAVQTETPSVSSLQVPEEWWRCWWNVWTCTRETCHLLAKPSAHSRMSRDPFEMVVYRADTVSTGWPMRLKCRTAKRVWSGRARSVPNVVSHENKHGHLNF